MILGKKIDSKSLLNEENWRKNEERKLEPTCLRWRS